LGSIKFLQDRQIYEEVTLSLIPEAKKFLWIGTADIKDLYVHKGRKMVPFLEILAGLLDRGVEVRLIHAKEPGKNFRTDFDKYPVLFSGLQRLLCPRIHFKSIIVDGRIAYTGSANLTGAGLGAKAADRRNFEAGILTDEPELVNAIANQFDQLWIGAHCPGCKRKEYCDSELANVPFDPSLSS
jgi:phosphatidylserine/phosphatidylglycerophosphate/cardiolipin synthase-like enzyme